MADLRDFSGPNAGYILGLFDEFERDPAAVGPEWQEFFRDFRPADAGAPAPAAGGGAGADLRLVIGARELARAIRSRGHTAASLDPLGSPKQPDPALDPAFHNIREAELEGLDAMVVRGPAAAGARDAAAGIARLREIYTGSVGYEFGHIPDAAERQWIAEAIETQRFAATPGAGEERALLERLSQVEGFESYLHKRFVGQKRFSIEGTDMMVPMLDELIARAAETGAGDVVIGMAHRGRLNVLTHVLGKPYEKMLAGFPGVGTPAGLDDDGSDIPSGDVKYHMGWTATREFGGREVRVMLSPNPSHLEFVDPVVVGMTRAAQDETSEAGRPKLNPAAALAILIHGDAAFPGQGIIAETLNMSCLGGYTVGGTIHLIANNQIGFTTNPEHGRSTRYASDLAKGFQVPVVHVNADDATTCLMVARLAAAYRTEYHKDFVIDLVGYRRWGHNEGDEPAFTQPVMYEQIRAHPTARALLATRLEEAGVVQEGEAAEMLEATFEKLAGVQSSIGDSVLPPPVELSNNGGPPRQELRDTGVAAETLRELNEAMLAIPDNFSPNTRLSRNVLEKRRAALGPDGGIDWGHAEALAFASLLAEGTPVRMTGQDAQRGTFSHRHLVLHDSESGERLNLLAHLPQACASFEIYNSPLSENAVVGFEYGYSVFDPQVLVIWEAQFGDFANGAQVMVDQFLSSAEQKWAQTSGLVMLLPHGYEGQGPEHSSARLERFLQLAAEGNLRIANCTTSAQYFHLLRRQAVLLDSDPQPLIVMSPKSLLRHPMAVSNIEQLSQGTFQPVLPDETAEGREGGITRLLLCSGKVYVDLAGSDARQAATATALARIEELYPLPREELEALFASLPRLEEIVWVQEEPSNMGAWSYIGPRLSAVAPDDVAIRYIGRPERASPAEGSSERHAAEQARIVAEAWEAPAKPAEMTEADEPELAAKA